LGKAGEMFEAAVGGGIPLLGPIAQDLAANRIARVRGVVNGTTNYILTAMAREGRDYAGVLREAQAKGYAEADPTADVEGLDAVNKLVILARLAFGAWISPDAVSNHADEVAYSPRSNAISVRRRKPPSGMPPTRSCWRAATRPTIPIRWPISSTRLRSARARK